MARLTDPYTRARVLTPASGGGSRRLLAARSHLHEQLRCGIQLREFVVQGVDVAAGVIALLLVSRERGIERFAGAESGIDGVSEELGVPEGIVHALAED